MSAWVPVPEPVTWKLPVGLTHNGVAYTAVTLKAPTAEDVLKATAVQGASGLDVTLRIIESISGVPYDLLKTIPQWLIIQMSDYTDEFVGAPAPDPLESWRAARRAARAAETQPTS